MERCKPYLKAGKGGITVSGGEPLLQPEFVKNLFIAVKELGLTTAIDTAGGATPRAWEKVLPYTDYVLFCCKATTPSTCDMPRQAHTHMCGLRCVVHVCLRMVFCVVGNADMSPLQGLTSLRGQGRLQRQ